MDVLKIIHKLGLNVVPRTTEFSEFVRLFDVYCRSSKCGIGIKLTDGLRDWEIEYLRKNGFNVPRPDIVQFIGSPFDIPLNVVMPKKPVFYLTMHEQVSHSFVLMITSDGVVLEGVEGFELWKVRRLGPQFRLTESGFEHGRVPDELRKLWKRASVEVSVEHPMAIIIEGWKYTKEMRVYDVEIAIFQFLKTES